MKQKTQTVGHPGVKALPPALIYLPTLISLFALSPPVAWSLQDGSWFEKLLGHWFAFRRAMCVQALIPPSTYGVAAAPPAGRYGSQLICRSTLLSID